MGMTFEEKLKKAAKKHAKKLILPDDKSSKMVDEWSFKDGGLWSREETLREVTAWLRSEECVQMKDPLFHKMFPTTHLDFADAIEARFLKDKQTP
jgi:hypothetical protein